MSDIGRIVIGSNRIFLRVQADQKAIKAFRKLKADLRFKRKTIQETSEGYVRVYGEGLDFNAFSVTAYPIPHLYILIYCKGSQKPELMKLITKHFKYADSKFDALK